jgi:hypothetical protein
MTSDPNTQEAIWASDSPPRVPVARMIASGPLAANRKPTRLLTAWVAERSRQRPGVRLGAEMWASTGMSADPGDPGSDPAGPAGLTPGHNATYAPVGASQESADRSVILFRLLQGWSVNASITAWGQTRRV